MAEEVCCLCFGDVSQGSMKSKRIRVCGEAGRVTRDVLNSLCSRFYHQNFSESVGSQAFFCKKCRTKIEGLAELSKKIQSTEKEIVEAIGSVLRNHDTFQPQQNHPAKRRRQEGLVCQEQQLNEDQEQNSLDKDQHGVSVKISFPSGTRNYAINTPWRRQTIKKLARKSLRSFSSSVTTAQATSGVILKQVASNIKKEIKHICSDAHNSLIRDTDSNDGIMYFRWDRLFHELAQSMPVLVSLLLSLISGKDHSKRVTLVCVIASMLLKHRFPKMALLQRAISVLLYGNGSSKEVYNCLQPLMLTLSHAGTIKLINRLTEDHDVTVQYWSHELLNNLKKRRRSKEASRSLSFFGEGYDSESCDNDNIVISPEFEGENVLDDEDDAQENEHIDNMVDDREMTRDMSSAVDILQEVEAVMETLDESEDYGGFTSQINPEDDELLDEDSDWCGFKIVGDNFDKNFRRTFQRIDLQTESRHYFHMYAVKDRVNLSTMSDVPRDGVIDVPRLLPSLSDHEEMRKNFTVLMSRILVKNFAPFKEKAKSIVWHIEHQYSQEMKQKSITVPLGIILKNENKTDEMCEILQEIHKYIPTITTEKSITLPNGEPHHYIDTDMWEILLGGDQLTVARARGAIDVRYTHESGTDRLHGLLPVAEDWHARMTLLKVIWTELYSNKSSSDKGTLFQLKNVLNRSSVPSDPKDQIQATEDFFELVLMSHVIVAAEKEYSEGMSLEDTIDAILKNYVHLEPNSTGNDGKDDLVHSYACKLLTLGMIWLNYYDAVKEGDGHRVMRTWKYLMVLFRLTGHRNYVKEAALLLITYHFSSSERVAAEILTGRFVNTKGRQGCNLPCDLHLEHLNRRLKGVLSRMESNVKPKCITRAAKALRAVDQICRCFRDELSLQEVSDIHHKPSHAKDLKIVIDVLREKKIWDIIPNRHHSFITRSHSSSILGTVKREDIEDWIIDKIIPSFV